MLFITIINFLDNKVGAAFSVITTIGKMIPIAAIIIFGIFWGGKITPSVRLSLTLNKVMADLELLC